METKNLPEEFFQKVIDKMEKRGANLPCPRCGGESCYIERGIVLHILQNSAERFLTYGSGVICVLSVCERCGYISEHSLEALGLIEEAKRYAKESEGKKE